MIHALAARFEEDVETITVRGDPNGLAYDSYDDVLYVADGASGAIICVDGEHHRTIATIDSGGVTANSRIGGLVATPYGTQFVTRLGYGRAGAVLRVEPDGQVEEVRGLSPRFWRLGIAYDSHAHLLYTTQFLKAKSGPFDGSIVEIDLADDAVTAVIGGFVKPVGIVKLGSVLVVTDACQRAVFRVDRVDGRATCTRFAELDRPDACCACGPDSMLVTAYDEHTRIGSVHQLWLDGRARMIGTGSWQPRGVATDGERVFVAARRTGRVLVFRL